VSADATADRTVNSAVRSEQATEVCQPRPGPALQHRIRLQNISSAAGEQSAERAANNQKAASAQARLWNEGYDDVTTVFSTKKHWAATL